jgi:hypothetical protein
MLCVFSQYAPGLHEKEDSEYIDRAKYAHLMLQALFVGRHKALVFFV